MLLKRAGFDFLKVISFLSETAIKMKLIAMTCLPLDGIQSQQVFENSFQVEKELSNQSQAQVPGVFVCAATIPLKDLLILTRAHCRIILFLWFPTLSPSTAVTILTLYLILNLLNNKFYFTKKISLKSEFFIFLWFLQLCVPLMLCTVLHPGFRINTVV